MINRRGFFGTLIAASATRTLDVSAAPIPTRPIEPIPPWRPLRAEWIQVSGEEVTPSSRSTLMSTLMFPVGYLESTVSIYTMLGSTAIVPSHHRVPKYRVEAGPNNECFSIDCDLSASGVAAALEQLHWTPGDGPIPILCVSPLWFVLAKEIEASYAGELAIHAAHFCDDLDTWFVAWRGRRMGSNGG